MRIEAHHDRAHPLREELTRGLVSYNDAHGPPERYEHVGFYAFDEDQTLCGGLAGELQWDWIFIALLWVRTPRRGLGRRLIEAAESHARSKGRRGLFLDTMEFQARPFYEKMGFEIFGVIEEAAGPFARYFMRKRLE